MKITNIKATKELKHGVGYIYLNDKRATPVESISLSISGRGMADIVLDFDAKTNELVGIEFLDLSLMPSNWKKVAINYDN